MVEKRREERRHLSYYLRIYDRDSGDVLGHIVDITSIGARILSNGPLDTGTNTVYRLRIDLGSVMNFEQQVVFDARCVWQEKEFTSGAYNSGLEIVKISEKGREIIKMLVEQFGG